MADSLREQLLKSGIVKQVQGDKRRDAARADAGRTAAREDRKRKRHRDDNKQKSSGEIDLARAYAMRAQTEAAERKRAHDEAVAQAQARKERKRKLQETLQGRALNKADADRVRHFEYGGKIRRIYVDAAQLVALNTGEMGVVQFNGRHVLVERAVALQVQALACDQVALLVDPDAAAPADDVPDDLMW